MGQTLAIFRMQRPANSPLRDRLELASFFGQVLVRKTIPNDWLNAVLDRLAVVSDEEVAGLWPGGTERRLDS